MLRALLNECSTSYSLDIIMDQRESINEFRPSRGDVVVLLFDVSDKKALESLPVKMDHSRVVLVAKKIDLEYWRSVKGEGFRSGCHIYVVKVFRVSGSVIGC